MTFFSLFRNVIYKIHYVFCMILIPSLVGCYSFTGGSIPPHIKNLQISTVEDISGFGNPLYRDELTTRLFDKFRNDNSFTLVETNGDAKLDVQISTIKDEPQTVQSNELVSENRVTIICRAEYYDYVKKKIIWEKNFTTFDVYDIGNAQAGRDEAILNALEQAADDILMAVVSGW